MKNATTEVDIDTEEVTFRENFKKMRTDNRWFLKDEKFTKETIGRLLQAKAEKYGELLGFQSLWLKGTKRTAARWGWQSRRGVTL